MILKERQVPKYFLLDLHKKFYEMNLALEIEDNELIVYNDTQNGLESEPFYLNNLMTLEQVLNHLCNWPGLGLLSYRHSNFRLPVTINFHTWDDNLLDGFTIEFDGSEVALNEKLKKELISDITTLVDFKYVVGDISNVSSTYINLQQSLPEILEYVEKWKFEIDIRN